MIATEPEATPVTRPVVGLTEAVAGLLLVQVTVVATPASAFTAAAICKVCPTEIVTPVGPTVTLCTP